MTAADLREAGRTRAEQQDARQLLACWSGECSVLRVPREVGVEGGSAEGGLHSTLPPFPSVQRETPRGKSPKLTTGLHPLFKICLSTKPSFLTSPLRHHHHPSLRKRINQLRLEVLHLLHSPISSSGGCNHGYVFFSSFQALFVPILTGLATDILCFSSNSAEEVPENVPWGLSG
jgi:hypothetical protein